MGINTVTAGNLPAPGTLLYLDYFQSAAMPVMHGADGSAMPVDFNLRAVTNAARLLYTWKAPSIGGLKLSTGVVAPLVDLSARLAGYGGSDWGVADLDLQNYLGGSNSSHTVFYFVGVDLSLPTGHYSRGAAANVGLNHYSVSPNVGVTWMPSRTLELTGAASAEVNTVNPATRYLSGTTLDIDYAATYRPLPSVPQLGLGLQGYVLEQISDDMRDGATAGPDGNRSQEFGFGPQLRWDTPAGGVSLKYQRVFGAQNRASGDKLWVEFCLPLVIGAPM
ncbi:MAG TPA: transporter [Caulobacteraceae bacterium]|nr:transporter [Caulobacteraceae bacterium]